MDKEFDMSQEMIEASDLFDMNLDDPQEATLEDQGWEYVASKDVYDENGFRDVYCWYKKDGNNRFFFSSDVDYGDPEYFDWETDGDEAAQEWFDSYGEDEEVDDDFTYESFDELKEDWSVFNFSEGNPYIAKTEEETERIINKYGDRVKKIKDHFYFVDNKEKESDLFSFNEFDDIDESCTKVDEAYGYANDYWHDIAVADDRKKAFLDWVMADDKRLQSAYEWYKDEDKDALHELVVDYLDEHFVPDDMYIFFDRKKPDWDSDDPFAGVKYYVAVKGTNEILYTANDRREAEDWMDDHNTWTDETYDLWYKDAKRAVNEIGYYQFSDEEEVDESLKDKKLKETAEGKDELDLYLNNEEWAYRRLEKIVNDGIAKKWSKRAITFGVAREIYNLKDAFGRLPTTRQERLEIANDFVEALLPDDYMEEKLEEGVSRVISKEEAKDLYNAGRDIYISNGGKPALGFNIVDGESLDEVVDFYYNNADDLVFLAESLKEGVGVAVSEKDDATVLSASTLPVANKLIEAINGEWDTIVLYNDIITELKENNFDDIIPVIQDIVKEENTHVGQLQKALSTISPDTNDIASGEVEAEGQLNESLEECDDCEYSDDFDTDDEYELYRTDPREIPYGKDQKRLRDRRLVDRDREPIYHPVREETECQCVDIENEDRVNEREIRMALEDGTLTKDQIVEYALRNTPDEMLAGMLSMESPVGYTDDILSDDAYDWHEDAVSVDDLSADDLDAFDVDIVSRVEETPVVSAPIDSYVSTSPVANIKDDDIFSVSETAKEDDIDENEVNMIL